MKSLMLQLTSADLSIYGGVDGDVYPAKRVVAETALDVAVLEFVIAAGVERLNASDDLVTYIEDAQYPGTQKSGSGVSDSYKVALETGAARWTDDGNAMNGILTVKKWAGKEAIHGEGVLADLQQFYLPIRFFAECNADTDQDVKVSWVLSGTEHVSVLTGTRGTVGEAFNAPRLMVNKGWEDA